MACLMPLRLSAERGLPFFGVHFFQDGDVQSLVGYDLFEPPIFFFKLFDPQGFFEVHSFVFVAPAVIGLFRNVAFPADATYRFISLFFLSEDSQDSSTLYFFFIVVRQVSNPNFLCGSFFGG